MLAENGPDPLIGLTLDNRYRVESRIGRGGMGDVYRAEHLLLGSQVALKVLAGERSADPAAARRFVREAKSAFRIDHTHVVRVTDLGASGTLLYIVMEYLDGRTVAEELMVDGPLSPGRAVHVARQVAEALDHAHGLGLVHRDLKPENLMLLSRAGDPDFVKVLDFGLARIFDEHGDLAGTAISLAPLTKDGLVFGTPEYMSPEQASGRTVGPESDLYGLGAVLYHMVTGEMPFSGTTFTEILSKQVKERVVPPSVRAPDRGISRDLDQLILGCLAKSPRARPPGARALADRLAALEAELGAAAPRPVPPVLAASETMDLAGRAVMATAETRDLAPVAPAPAAMSGAMAAAAPLHAPATAEAIAAVAGPRRRRLFLALAILALAAGGVATLIAVARSGRHPHAAAATEPASARAPVEGTAGTPRVPPPHAAPGSAAPTPAEASLHPTTPVAGDPQPVAAPAADAGPAPHPATRSHAPHRTAAQIQAEKHLHAAEAARKDGNLLLQLAQADQAHRLDPRNRRAAELMGEALVKSGDKARGCPLLRHTRLYRQVGCSH